MRAEVDEGRNTSLADTPADDTDDSVRTEAPEESETKRLRSRLTTPASDSSQPLAFLAAHDASMAICQCAMRNMIC